MTYDDGDVGFLNMGRETWQFVGSCSRTYTLSASTAFELQTSFQLDLKAILDHFGNKVFLFHPAQGFSLTFYRRHTRKKKQVLRKPFVRSQGHV